MANYTTQAINLKSYNLAESDKIMVMYSRDHGIIRCVAKGIKKPTSKLSGRMETLNANKLFLAKGKKLDIICQAELVDGFKEIRKDITKLTYAIYCAELINTFGLENDSNSAQIYDIFFETLKNISLSSSSEDTLWTVIRFKLRLMHQLGYAVELNNCVKCNEQIQGNYFFFSAESGGVVCRTCRNEMYQTSDLDSNIVRILKDAMTSDFSEVSFDNKDILDDKIAINQLTLDYSFKLLKEYISTRSDKKLKTPELIECLC